MAVVIKPKRGTNTPGTDDITSGEIAVDTSAQKLYINDSGTIKEIGGTSEAFKTISVSGQSDVVADSTTDTLTLAAGSNVTITTAAGSDTITFAASGASVDDATALAIALG